MERVRYTGPDPARLVALPGGSIRCERMRWVDLETEAAKAGIGAHHIPIVQRGLLIQDDWQGEGPVKAARTRKANAKTEDEPAKPGKEQDQ